MDIIGLTYTEAPVKEYDTCFMACDMIRQYVLPNDGCVIEVRNSYFLAKHILRPTLSFPRRMIATNVRQVVQIYFEL